LVRGRRFNGLLTLYTPEEREVLTVRPGITDYASVHFPNEGEILKGSLDSDKDYMEKIHPKKMRLSLEYVKSRSFWVDLKINLSNNRGSFSELILKNDETLSHPIRARGR
jgi:lipopolysaccharide/colanic/teichoic acid biosynthesis glycosyltransferase